MSGLIGFLRDLTPFEEIVTRAASGDVQLAAPSFVHPFLISGVLAREPWKSAPVLVIAPDQDSAGELEHELSLYCQDRVIVYLPPRGAWFGSETNVKPRVAARRSRALSELEAARNGTAPAPVLIV
ncbi:MAG: hypothetical protein M1274_15760, partial [Actinobacteria bacterium]|nr:hypothetical protein [Actinomycetota bacterium]